MSKKQQTYASGQVTPLTDWFIYTMSTHPQSAAQGRAPGWRPCDGACELCCGLGWCSALFLTVESRCGPQEVQLFLRLSPTLRKYCRSAVCKSENAGMGGRLCAGVFYVLNCNCSSCFHSYHCLYLLFVRWINGKVWYFARIVSHSLVFLVYVKLNMTTTLT